jgi:hypothetical protein
MNATQQDDIPDRPDDHGSEERRGSGGDQAGAVEREAGGEEGHTGGPQCEPRRLHRPRRNVVRRRRLLRVAASSSGAQPGEEREEPAAHADHHLGEETHQSEDAVDERCP